MPKVSQEYITNKKKMIVDTAYELCLEKTLSTVTMQDIINRTGLSQGGIYRFYRDIDEIFADMLVAIRERSNIKEQVDEILEMADGIPTAEITNRIFEMLAEFMTAELMGIEKVDFELNVLAMNAPERVDKILAGAESAGNMEYIIQRISDFYRQKMQRGELKARVSSMELLTYISAAFSGIQMSCIVNNCYRKGPMSGFYQPKMQLRTLAKTVNYLLGTDT